MGNTIAAVFCAYRLSLSKDFFLCFCGGFCLLRSCISLRCFNTLCFSGGEKQRISIARAIIKDSPVIILDEATANVDPENEWMLQNAIQELTKSKTVIMIAHRLKTVRHADKIIVLDGGRIVEEGTHKELLAKQGKYAEFIAMREKSVGWKLGSAMQNR